MGGVIDKIRFIDLFSGIGGFRLGLERANGGVGAKLTAGKGGHQDQKGISADSGREDGNGRREHTDGRGRFTCVWSCDWSKYANQVYLRHWPEANHHPGDVRGFDQREIPDFDLLCAGFPCQSFSVAGKRKGFKDTRGTLFFEICRIAEAKRPPLLLLENVRGLLSHDKGLTFQIILESLEELGYWAEWQVLNSKHFGVPQNRERVFIIGHLRGEGSRPVFPIIGGNGEAFKELKKIGNIAETGHDSLWGRVYDPIGLAMNLNAEGGGVGAKTGLYAVSFTNPHNPEEVRRVNLSDVSRAVKPPYGNQQPLILADRTRSYADLGRNLESPKEITNAISSFQKDNLLLENFRIRRLTPVECERLQGFPDGRTRYGYAKGETLEYEDVYGEVPYETEDGEIEIGWGVIGKEKLKPPLDNTVRISDTQRYKMLGNAVTVNVVEFLGRRIKEPWS